MVACCSLPVEAPANFLLTYTMKLLLLLFSRFLLSSGRFASIAICPFLAEQAVKAAAAADKELAILAEGHTFDSTHMASKRARVLACGCVPHHDGLVITATCDALAVA